MDCGSEPSCLPVLENVFPLEEISYENSLLMIASKKLSEMIYKHIFTRVPEDLAENTCSVNVCLTDLGSLTVYTTRLRAAQTRAITVSSNFK